MLLKSSSTTTNPYDNSFISVFVLSGDFPQIGRSELLSILESNNIDYNIIDETSRIILVSFTRYNNSYDKMFQRIAYCTYFGILLFSYNFNSDKKLWSIITLNTATGKKSVYTCNFIFSCSGYYNYDEGYSPEFKCQSDYKGDIIHPQKWPENFDCTNKKIVVIGSGATAVTIVPELASKASHITMLQRSPTYIGNFPSKDKIGAIIKSIFPKKLAHNLIRFKNILIQIIFFKLCRSFPERMKEFIIKSI